MKSLTDLRAMEKPNLPGFVVIGTKPTGEHVGCVENSFSMSLSADRTQFLWGGTAHSNFGTTHQLDADDRTGLTLATLKTGEPQIEWKAYDVHDPSIPFVFDWDEWRWGSSRSDETLSGVTDKYVARNPRFYSLGPLFFHAV